MKTTAIALSAFLLLTSLAASAADEIHGAWTVTADERGKLYLHATRAGNWGSYGDSIQLTGYQGLSLAQIQSTTQVPVQFRRATDAGTITFDGTFRNQDGAGQFTFAPNTAYLGQVRGMGVTVDRPRAGSKETEGDALFRLTLIDLSLGYIREMHGVYPEASLHELTALRATGVTTRYLNDMRAAGVTIENSREAKKLSALGVTPDYIRELAGAGYKNLTTRQLVKLRASGVNAKFIRDMSNIH
jgi:hypothetical protein